MRLSDAKSRLSTQTAGRRRDLVVAMALDVIAAARDCPPVAEVVVVADDPGLHAVSGPDFSDVRFEADLGEGLNPALLAGARGATGPVAALLADVPCATPQLIEAALAACADRPVIVSDAEGIGTTLLAAPTGDAFHPRFGARSRAAHISMGAEEVVDAVPGEFARLRRDVDSEVDLWDAGRLGLGSFTQAVVDAPKPA